jgi:hypothetical protein
MKRTISLSCATLMAFAALPVHSQPAPQTVPEGAEGPAATPPSVSPAVAEVIRLAQSGVGDDVVLAYIQNSAGGFNLSADQILYVRDVGLSSEIISAMLNKDANSRNAPPSAQPLPSAPAPQPAPPLAPTVPVEAPLTPQEPAEVSSPPVQVNYFYSSLSPYGSWVDLEGVGWCWQPSAVVVNRAWQPYCDHGHWVSTDAGWFWQSDYSWGWAPFHYGRWQLHPRCGWVWLPDTVWGPSWVIWRSSGDRCGWAPLPPHAVFDVRLGWTFNGLRVRSDFDFGLRPSHFTFVGLHDFNERDLGHHRLPAAEVTKIYNNTTIINNYTVNNTTVVNRGIPVERVSAVARTPVHHATIREAPAGSTRVNFAGRTTAKEAVVYKPVLKAPPKVVPVAVQKVDDRHPVIQHQPSVSVSGQTRGTVQTTRGAAGSVHPIQPETAGRSSTEAPSTSRQPLRTRPSQSESFNAPAAGPRTPQPPVTAPSTPRQNPQRSSRPLASEGVGAPRAVPESRSPEPAQREPSVESRSANSHAYYPKSYHQAEELRPSQSKQATPAQSQSNQSNQRSRRDQ